MELFQGCFSEYLNNGLQVLGQEEPKSKSISLGLWFKSGSRDEELNQNGITHLIEHLLFRGTENRTAYQITSDVDRLGGHINGSTSREFLLLSLRLLPESLAEGVEILTDLAVNPLFQKEDIKLEKNVVIEEIRSSRDDHQSEVIRLLEESIWGEESGLARPIQGTESAVTNLTRNLVEERFNKLCRPQLMLFTAAGNLTFSDLKETVENRLGHYETDNLPELDRTHSPGNSKTKIKKDWREINQTHFAIGVEGLPKCSEKRFPLEMLNVILGQGMSSRLFRKIRKEHGLAYEVTTNTRYFSDTGLFFVYGALAPENLAKFVDLTLKELQNLRSQPVTTKELRLAKNKTKGNLVLGLENNHALMGRLGTMALQQGEFLSIQEVIEKIEEVTKEDIMNVAAELFPKERRSYSLLGPKLESIPEVLG